MLAEIETGGNQIAAAYGRQMTIGQSAICVALCSQQKPPVLEARLAPSGTAQLGPVASLDKVQFVTGPIDE